MAAASRQPVLDRLVPLLTGLFVVAATAGSSSVPSLIRIGSKARWAVLVLLLVAALAWARRAALRLSPQLLAAAAFVGLAILSATWSVAPRTSLERGVSLGLLFAACLAVAAAVRGRSDRGAAVLAGLLGGAAVVGVGGLLLLAVDRARAVEPASYEAPARYQGLGQNPNTVGLLFAVATPLAVWAALRGSGRVRLAALAALLLFAGTIVASGSRGALVAGALGSAVVLLLAAPRRAAAVAVVAAAFVAAAGIQSLPKPAAASPAPVAAAGAAPPPARHGYVDAEAAYPLDADVGQPLPGGGQPPVRRGLLGASGRLDAWGGALHEAARRPLVGHGFGAEQDVFVDRFYRFVGGLPENSYLGLALQLGAAGLLALAALVGTLARPGARALRGPDRGLAAASLGVLAAGLAIAVVQSYVYSVGNVATGTLWLSAFLLPALAENVVDHA